MESYLGISVFNKSISPNSGEVGVITDKIFIQKDKDFAFSWKHINYSSSSILDAIYIIKEDDTRIKLQELNLNDFSVVNVFDNKEEHLCYIKYKSDFTGIIRLQIGRKQIQADREDIKAFDIRHLLFERGINVNSWRPKLESPARQLAKMKAEIKQLNGLLSLSASKEDFNDLEQKISNALSKIDIQANQIQNTVTVDNLTSYLRQDAEAIMIGFNGISDSVSITRKGIRVWHEGKGYTHMGHEEIYQTDNTAGIKLLSLYNGAYRCFRHDDGRYLGYFGSTYKVANTGHHAYGMQIAGAYPCWYTAIGYNDKVYNPDDESMTGFKSALEVVFFRHLQDGYMLEPGTHIRHGRLDMHNHNIYNCGIIWYDSAAYDATYKHNDGAMTIQCEDVIKFIRNSSKNEQREACRFDFPANEIKFNMDMNGQGYAMYNTIWQGTYVQPTVLFSTMFAKVAPTSLLDNIDVVNTQTGKLGLAKIPSPFLCLKSSLDSTETHNVKETFEYEQIIFSLVKEVKELKEEIKQMKEGV